MDNQGQKGSGWGGATAGAAGLKTEETPGGGIKVFAAWLLVIAVYGLSLAYFKNTHTYREFIPLRADILSEGGDLFKGDSQAWLRKERFVKDGIERSYLWVEGPAITVPFKVDSPQELKFRIKGYFQNLGREKPDLKVYINGNLSATFSPKWNSTVQELDFNAVSSLIHAGVNAFSIEVAGGAGRKLGLESITYRNYSGVSKNFPKAYVIFDGNHTEEGFGPFNRKQDYLLYPPIMFLAIIIAANAALTAKGLSMPDAMKRSFLFHWPALAIFLTVMVFSALTEYALILRRSTFLILLFAAPAVSIAYYLAIIALGRLKRLGGFAPERASGKKAGSGQGLPGEGGRKMIEKLRTYARRAGTASVIAFMALLFAAGTLLILKKQEAAERAADIAYFVLVFGVLMRVFEMKRDGPGESR